MKVRNVVTGVAGFGFLVSLGFGPAPDAGATDSVPPPTVLGTSYVRDEAVTHSQPAPLGEDAPNVDPCDDCDNANTGKPGKGAGFNFDGVQCDSVTADHLVVVTGQNRGTASFRTRLELRVGPTWATGTVRDLLDVLLVPGQSQRFFLGPVHQGETVWVGGLPGGTPSGDGTGHKGPFACNCATPTTTSPATVPPSSPTTVPGTPGTPASAVPGTPSPTAAGLAFVGGELPATGVGDANSSAWLVGGVLVFLGLLAVVTTAAMRKPNR